MFIDLSRKTAKGGRHYVHCDLAELKRGISENSFIRALRSPCVWIGAGVALAVTVGFHLAAQYITSPLPVDDMTLLLRETGNAPGSVFGLYAGYKTHRELEQIGEHIDTSGYKGGRDFETEQLAQRYFEKSHRSLNSSMYAGMCAFAFNNPTLWCQDSTVETVNKLSMGGHTFSYMAAMCLAFSMLYGYASGKLERKEWNVARPTMNNVQAKEKALAMAMLPVEPSKVRVTPYTTSCLAL